MADRAQAARRSPFHGVSLPNRVGVVRVNEAPPAARFVFRGDAGLLGAAFGPTLPAGPCRAEVAGERAALWLGPDEWLLIAPEADDVASSLASALEAKPCALVDVGHRNTAMIVEGPAATDLLAAGCPLDLDAGAFPIGMCVRTVFAKAEIVLWRTAPEAFRLEVQRSFAPYVAGLLSEAARSLA